ncbi:hypothetical protein E1B28_011665 [Marasmius oreades]|uniref:Uncharacterized protein n=1 Tax=Marasmius oreades TaxID=181124 RepID=A0A9P7URF8_9AGAR|nr:uncharacterized protein E1B28_011665 [Marasmius oreades]KAG7090046.1 hypothetical protein E1B28_011665 [Marasmius oreades]
MEILTGASKVKIRRGNFSSVRRDQFNNCTIVQTRDKRTKVDRHLPELSEFTEIKRGDIVKDKDVCYSWQLCSNRKDDTAACVYIAQIMISGQFGESKYTVKTFHGRNAIKEWGRDFSRCSRDWHGDIPLFGYNKSSVPSLIFCGELVPVAHMEARMGWVALFYIELLRYSLGCSKNELWMNPTKGRFCRGPIGPRCRIWLDVALNVIVPPDVDCLKEDVILRYFLSKENDWGLLATLSYSRHFETLDNIPATSHIHVISGLTNSMIASFENVRWWSWADCLDNEPMMPDGVARFRLRDDGLRIEVHSVGERTSWLSQALSVFHALNISLNEDLSSYKLVLPYLELTGTLQRSKCKRRRRQLLHTPIYLIVLPSPHPHYHWSFDPTGQISLSPEMCKYLGLPLKLSLEVTPCQVSWATEVYKHIRDYQIARKFDPRTTDFARSLREPIFEVTFAENRCQEIVEDHKIPMPIESEALPSPEVNNSQGLSQSVPDSNVSYQNKVEERGLEEPDSFLLDETEGSAKNTERTTSASTRKGHRHEAFTKGCIIKAVH